MAQARVLVMAGALLLALYVTGAVVLGTTPVVDDSSAQIAQWFLDHRDAARLYAWTATFGTLAGATIAAIIRGLLPAPHRDVFLLGAAAFVVETAARSGSGPAWPRGVARSARNGQRASQLQQPRQRLKLGLTAKLRARPEVQRVPLTDEAIDGPPPEN